MKRSLPVADAGHKSVAAVAITAIAVQAVVAGAGLAATVLATWRRTRR